MKLPIAAAVVVCGVAGLGSGLNVARAADIPLPQAQYQPPPSYYGAPPVAQGYGYPPPPVQGYPPPPPVVPGYGYGPPPVQQSYVYPPPPAYPPSPAPPPYYGYGAPPPVAVVPEPYDFDEEAYEHRGYGPDVARGYGRYDPYWDREYRRW